MTCIVCLCSGYGPPGGGPIRAGTKTRMYVCVCNGLTDRDIRRAGDQGHCTVASAYCSLGAEVNCGRCVPMARQLITKQNELNANIPAEAAE